MRRQRGIILWVVLGAIAVAGVASGWAWIEGERRKAAQTERDAARALAKAREVEVADWRSKVKEVADRCAAATAKAAAEAEDRDREAEKRLAAAQAGAQSWRAQADALRAAKAMRPSQPLTEAQKACPAGAAVAKVREVIR